MHRDIFHYLKAIAALAYGQLTATKTDALVIDRRDHPTSQIVGFIVTVPAVTAADGSNFFEFELWEADDKASGTALDASAAKVSNEDILGYTVNGVRSVTANPAHDPTEPASISTELANLQNGFVPRVNAVGQAGAVFFFQYRGYKPCLQLRPTETGTADITAVAVAVLYNGETVNLVNPA